GDGHLPALEDLYEDHCGGHAAEIHRRAGPVEQHGFDRAAVGATVGKAHATISVCSKLQIVDNLQDPAACVNGAAATHCCHPARSCSGLAHEGSTDGPVREVEPDPAYRSHLLGACVG